MKNIDQYRHALREGTPTEQANNLWALAMAVDVPDDLMLLIAGLMNDRSPARMYIPFRYGELRYIAAETYAKLQFQRGREEPVILRDGIYPRKRESLDRIGEVAGLDAPYLDSLAWFTELRERNLIPVADEVFDLEYFSVD